MDNPIEITSYNWQMAMAVWSWIHPCSGVPKTMALTFGPYTLLTGEKNQNDGVIESTNRKANWKKIGMIGKVRVTPYREGSCKKMRFSWKIDIRFHQTDIEFKDAHFEKLLR